MRRFVRPDAGLPWVLGGIAGTVLARTHASTGVVYLVGFTILAVCIGLAFHEEGIDVRRLMANSFKARWRKP